MIKARKLVPAVAVVAVLGTGLASVGAFSGTNAALRIKESAAQVQEQGQPTPQPADVPADALPSGAVPPTSAAQSSRAQPSGSQAAATAPAAVTASDATFQSPRVADPGPGHGDDALANCDKGPGTYRPATEPEFQTVMTGVWLLCQSPSLFGTSEAGMELRADGRWSKLERTPSGALARSGGWGNEGSWSTYVYQLNVYVDGAGASYTTPSFGVGSSSSGITKVKLDHMSGSVAYVPAPAGTKILPVPFPPAPGKGCDAREELYSPTSEAEFRSAMIGTWLVCSKPTFFGSDEDGVEVRADGRWSKLYRTSKHSLVRASGPGNEGTWETIDTSVMNGRPTYQINFNLEGTGGSVIAIPALSGQASDVTKLRLNNEGVFVADYVPAPTQTVVTGS